MKHLLDAQNAFLEQGWEDVELSGLGKNAVQFTLTFGPRRWHVTCTTFNNEPRWNRDGLSMEAATLGRMLEHSKNELIHYRVHDIVKPTFYEARALSSFDALEALGNATPWDALQPFKGGIQIFGDTALYSSPRATPATHITGASLNYMPQTFLVKRNVTECTGVIEHAGSAGAKMRIVQRYYIAVISRGSPAVSYWANVTGP